MHPDWLIHNWLRPEWPAPVNVRACMTTRAGGVSRPPFDSMNPAAHVGDDPEAVAENRRLLRAMLPAEPAWLNQVHGDGVAMLDEAPPPQPSPACGGGEAPPPQPSPACGGGGGRGEGWEADASVAMQPGQVCAVLTADCLPVLFCDRAGTRVAAAHAGWRGLAGGVLEATVAALGVPPEDILVWLGAAIGQRAFEVGDEVRTAFIDRHPLTAVAFRPAWAGTLDESPRKWLADIYALARIRLAASGVAEVYGGGLCTYTDRERFFSYRRDKLTGRMASLVWLE